jgi:hypothetical protein
VCIRYINIYVNIYKNDKELVQDIIEAKKSNNMFFMSWKPRKPGGIVQVQFQGLKTSGLKDIHPSLRAETMYQINSCAEKVNSPFFHLSVLFRPSVDWRRPPTVGRAICDTLSLPAHMQISLETYRHTQK